MVNISIQRAKRMLENDIKLTTRTYPVTHITVDSCLLRRTYDSCQPDVTCPASDPDAGLNTAVNLC